MLLSRGLLIVLFYSLYSSIAFSKDESNNNDIKQAVFYMTMYEKEKIKSPFSAIEYAKKALVIYEDFDHIDQCAALNYIGNIYFENKIYLLALDSYYKSLKVAQKFNDKSAIGYCYSDIGNINFHQGNFEIALSFYEKAVLIFKEIKKKEGIAVSINNIALVYQEQENFDKALEYLFKALNMRKDNHTLDRIAHSYYLISGCYRQQSKFELAIDYLNKAIKLFIEDKNDLKLAEMFYTKALILRNQNKYSRSIEYASKALKLFIKNRHNIFISKSYVLLTEIYLSSSDLNTATTQVNHAEKRARLANSFSLLMQVFRLKSTISYKKKKYDEALKFKTQEMNYKDSLIINTNNSEISNLKLSILTFSKENENELLKKDIIYSEKIRNLFLVALILFICLSSLLFYLIKQKIKINRRLRESKSHETESLSQELEVQNREIASRTIRRLKRESSIAQVIEKLRSLRLTKVSNKKLINSYIKDLEDVIHDNIWDEFRIRFEKVNKSFYENIAKKHPDLRQTELKLCAFLKLNMSTKEIAAITSKEQSSVDVARSRLRKKLNLLREENLVEYMSNF